MRGLATSSHVEGAIERGIEGHGISREDALALIEDAEPGSLLRAAAAVRDRSKGRAVSYAQKVFIPLTHLCRDDCGYCSFRADPAAAERTTTYDIRQVFENADTSEFLPLERMSAYAEDSMPLEQAGY